MNTNATLRSETSLKLARIILGVMIAATVAAVVSVVGGEVRFENPLPGGVFRYDGWMVILFSIAALAGGCVGLYYGVRSFLTEDVVEVTVNSKGEVLDRNAGNGCVMQLLTVLAAPVLCALIFYVAAYYIMWALLEVGAFVLPYVLLLAMAFGCFWYGRHWVRRPVAAGTPQNGATAEEGTEPDNRLRGIRRVLARLWGNYRAEVIGGTAGVVYLVAGILFVVDGFNLGGGDMQRIESRVEPREFVVTSEGIGTLRFGQPFVVDESGQGGLYDRIEQKSDGVFTDYTLWWGREKVASFTVSTASPEIMAITVYSSRISLANGVHPAMSAREAVGGEGVTIDLVPNSDMSRGYDFVAQCGSAILEIGGEGELLSADGQAAYTQLQSGLPSRTLRARDFTERARVVSITILGH